MRKEAKYVVLLGITYMLLFTGRTTIAPVLPLYARELGATDALIGMVVGAFGLARVSLDLPIGALVQKYKVGRIMVLSLSMLIASTLLAGTTTHLFILIMARLLEGASMSLFFVGGLTLMANITTTEKRGRQMSITSSLVEVGSLSGPAIGGVLAEFFGLRAPFFLYAMLASLCIPFLMPLRGVEPKPHREDPFWGAFGSLLTNKDLLRVNLGTFSLFLGRFAILYTGIPLVAYDNLGLSKASLGGLLALATLVSFLLLFPVGYFSDRIGRKPFMISALASSALIIALLGRANDEMAFMAYLLLYGLTTGLVGPTPAWFLDLAPPDLRGAAMGMYRFFNDLGLTLGPILMGLLIQFTRTERVNPLPFDALALILLLTALLLIAAPDPLRELRKGKTPALGFRGIK